MLDQKEKECDACEQAFIDETLWNNRNLCEECFQIAYEDAMVSSAESEAEGR